MNKLQREGDFAEMGSSNPPAKKEYIICSHDSISNLEIEVEECMRKGWKCQGGIHVTYSTVGGYPVKYYQAMIKN